ncbi:MAG: CopG family transcriptional regulator [Methylococcales bacterium]|nr:CopG family transcriptional regulator [Methylococcales bacterium]
MNNVIQAEIPKQLSEQAQMLIQRGWAGSLQEIINESLRRYLESHQEVLTEAFIQEDVEWGLRGDD